LRTTLVEADKSFKKMFPHLAKELTNEENKVTIDAVRVNPEKPKKQNQSDKFHNYNPTVVDFIRRCNTENEAEEIIGYMENRCEITKQQAQQLRQQLQHKGVRSFGAKKEDDYYFKQSGLY
jgi:hypothetical protein